MWPRAILHVDMDAFFAAVEQRENPGLKGKPVIISADPKSGKGRGVVSTASYEARAFGVRSAMPVSQAFLLCPQGIFLPVNFRLYGEVSRQVFGVFESFTPLVEGLSSDEAFLDVTGSQKLFGNAVEIARKIKGRILEETKLTCSIGVSAVKFVAKIASDINKPDGLTVVEPGKEKEFLAPLPLWRLWGVGPRTAGVLERMGLTTIGQLAKVPEENLTKRFGKTGGHLWRLANAIDQRGVHPEHEQKSIGAETTFEEDTLDEGLLRRTLLYLSEKVTARARREELEGKTVTLKIRLAPFVTLTRQKLLASRSQETQAIYSAATRLLEEFLPLTSPVRLLGVSLSRFSSQPSQAGLFDEPAKQKGLEASVDKIRERFGSASIVRASLLGSKKERKP